MSKQGVCNPGLKIACPQPELVGGLLGLHCDLAHLFGGLGRVRVSIRIRLDLGLRRLPLQTLRCSFQILGALRGQRHRD